MITRAKKPDARENTRSSHPDTPSSQQYKAPKGADKTCLLTDDENAVKRSTRVPISSVEKPTAIPEIITTNKVSIKVFYDEKLANLEP
jgi:hypothetical protein